MLPGTLQEHFNPLTKTVKETQHEVSYFAEINILDMKSQISQPASNVLYVKEFIFFSPNDILRTGCQARLSLH